MGKIRRIDLKTGFRCNNSCLFCVQGDKRSRYGNKPTAEIKRLIEAGRVDASEVVFTGGEVTIRDDLPELVAHAKALGFSVIQIQTNGRMLSSPRFLRSLVQAGATEFSPAIHGPNAKIHDALTQVDGAFRQTVKGVRNIKKLGLPVIINSVITQANYKQLPAIARLFVALQVDQFQLAYVHPLGTAQERFDEVVPRLSAIAPYVKQALRIGVDGGVRCMTEAIPLCFLGSYSALAAEWIIPRTKIFDAEMVVEDYTELRLNEGKAHGPVCESCIRRQECEGPWREYPERYGWGEFRPIL